MAPAILRCGLLRRADLALYDGKRRGKSLLVHYRPAYTGDGTAEPY